MRDMDVKLYNAVKDIIPAPAPSVSENNNREVQTEEVKTTRRTKK